MKMTTLFLFLFGVLPAQAFTLNSSGNSGLKGWAGKEMILLVNTDNCPAGVDVPAIIQDAVKLWNNVSTSSVKVSYGGTTTSTTFSSPATVYCETDFQTVVGADQNAVPGAASVTTAGGRINGGLLYLNASGGQGNIGNFDQTTLLVILAHEIGHLLGLGHSHDTEALMYYDASAKKNLSLGQDDIDGISYLYPSDEFSGDALAGCGTVSSLPPPTTGTKMFVLMLLLLPLGLLARLRVKT